MKNILFTICFTIIMAAISCNKTNVQRNSLAGKWNVIDDSSLITNSLNGFNGGRNYIGTSSDYYNFTPGGNLYIKEGSSFDTGKYSMPMSNKVEIVMFVKME